MEVEDLFVDLADGRIFLKFLEVISGEKLGKPNKGKMRIHKIENVNKCLAFLHSQVLLESIGAEDIVDGNPNIIMGLIWTIILRFHIQDIKIDVDEDTKSSQKKTSKDALLLWCQRLTNGYQGVHITDFTDSWRTGLGFNALLLSHWPGLFDYEVLLKQSNIENLNHAFVMAEELLGIQRLFSAEDVDTGRPDEKSIILYVASYYHAFARAAEMSTNNLPTGQVSRSNAEDSDTVAGSSSSDEGAHSTDIWSSDTDTGGSSMAVGSEGKAAKSSGADTAGSSMAAKSGDTGGSNISMGGSGSIVEGSSKATKGSDLIAGERTKTAMGETAKTAGGSNTKAAESIHPAVGSSCSAAEETCKTAPVSGKVKEKKMPEPTEDHRSNSQVIALHPYMGKDIAMVEGETLLLVSQTFPEWWTVRKANGTEGIVPFNYVKKIEKIIPLIALHPYTGKGITMVTGETLLLLHKTFPEWWSVRKADGTEGIVPFNYVKET